MFEASLARILNFSEKTFRCLFLSKPEAITFEPICGSDASSKRFFTRVAFVGVDLLILPCIDSWTNEYNEWSNISNWGQTLRLNSSHWDICYNNKLQFFLGSKFTSVAEGGGFYWLIHDSRWQNEIIVRVGGFQNPGVCRQAFPSVLPHPLPLLLLAPFSRCNSLLPNPTETLATQATIFPFLCHFRDT